MHLNGAVYLLRGDCDRPGVHGVPANYFLKTTTMDDQTIPEVAVLPSPSSHSKWIGRNRAQRTSGQGEFAASRRLGLPK